MARSNFLKARSVPTFSSSKSTPITTNFAKGINTYKPNDNLSASELFLAQDARFDRIGEYKTRRGLTKLCEPVSKAKLYDNMTEGYGMVSIKDISGYECTISHAAQEHKVYYSLVLIVSAENSEYGVLRINLKPSRDSDEILASTCVDPSEINKTPKEVKLTFIEAPEVSTRSCYVEFAPQGSTDEQEFRVGVNGTNLMCKLYMAAKGKVTSIFEANLSDATGSRTDHSVLFTFVNDGDESGEEILYRLDETGRVSELSRLTTMGRPVRYSQEASVVRCVFGDVPYTLNPTNLEDFGWEVNPVATKDLTTDTDLEIKVTNIMNGTQDNLLYFDKNTTTQAVWTYPYGYNYKDTVINSFDMFDRDYRQNFPSINTGDPLTAMFNLGGVIYILTRRHKYSISFSSAESWSKPNSCAADGGTYSQESTVCGAEYAYYANDDGIFVFDGYTESSITKNTIQSIYDNIPNKEDIRLEVYRNRLYVLCPSRSDEYAGTCLVYNLKQKLWESFDTHLYISAMFARKSTSRRFFCGHSRMGILMEAESQDNDYNDLGSAIHFELATAYQTFGTPSQLKHISNWRPEFATTEKPYSVQCGYALDLSEEVKYIFSVDLKNQQTFVEQYLWDDLGAYDMTVLPNKMSTVPRINGRFRRCQIRYQHHAAFEPVNFKSHTLTVQTERIR